MGKRASSRDDSPNPPSVTPDVGIELLRGQIERGRELLAGEALLLSRYQQWHTLTEDCVVKAFGDSSTHHYTFLTSGPAGRMVVDYGDYNPDAPHEQRERRQNLQDKVETLETLIEILGINASVKSASGLSATQSLPQSKRIFLVHGHDHQARAEVARFVEKLGVEVVILDEKPSQGRTIAEQLEKHGDVGFAIILLTRDDRGGSISRPVEEYQPRTRQNVMLELGYFWGRLGRNRVCALYVSGVEIPSDFQGVLFTLLDPHDGWKLKLFRELDAAGLNPSPNALK